MAPKTIVDLNTAIHDKVVELLSDEPHGSLADLGAGDGTLAGRLQKEGFDVTAVDAFGDDFRPSDIKVAMANLNEALPFPDAHFKAIVSTEVIEHLENPWYFLRELYRVTEPGGVVILSTPNMDSIYVRAWFLLTGRLYNFLNSSYRQIGHITPIYLWNLERMAEGKFDVETVAINASPVPKTPFRLPFQSRIFGQCIVVKLRRRAGAASAEGKLWSHSRIVREG
jgi:2-polyprenyl-3-methyl-5-hydroxy-6-metoxy-1,4-benzoquinol methylase